MKNRLIFMICLVGCICFTLPVALPTADAKGVHGVPFLVLQKQINALRHEVKELKRQPSNVDKEVIVDCTAGTISDALAEAPPGGRLIITVEGTCVENVTITRDDVTVQGGSGEVNGRITIDGARRVVIDGLTVSGDLHGILALGNATVTVQNSIIEGNGLSGIAVRFGAFALIENNTIRNNGECEILASDSGQVNMLNNEIVSNFANADICSAVAGYRDARIRMLGGNMVTQTTGSGSAVDISNGSTFRQDGGHDEIVGKVVVFNMTNADFRNVDITGDITVFLNSVLRLRDQGAPPTVNGNIIVGAESIADFKNSALIEGNVVCERGFVNGMEVNRGFINRSPNLTGMIEGCFAATPPGPLPPGPFPPEPPPMP